MRFLLQLIEGFDVTPKTQRKATYALSIALLAYALPQVAVAEKVELPPDAPYENILVIFLAESFDSRRYLETEIVKELEKKGTKAVRSTSMMNSRVPMTTETFVAMVDEIDADAVLVAQVADLQTTGTVVTMRPQSTYNIRPTWYFNVWSVELTEYVEPPAMNYNYKLSLATQLYSVQSEKAVWAMESKSNILEAFDKGPDYKVFINEARAIVRELRKYHLVAR